MSTARLITNGTRSYGTGSRHINIRYFFIKDVLKREGIELINYPTERMIAGYYTKPLQGSLFKKMRDILMGLAPFPAEECLGVQKKVSLEAKSSGNGDGPVSRNLGTMGKNKKGVTYADVVRGK